MPAAADWSTGQPALPNIGANFGAGTYNGYNLVKTVPANPSRRNIAIENDSGSPVVVVIDDGTAAVGAAPVNASVFQLAAGAGAGQQGGSWANSGEKGRLQVYSSIGSPQIMIREN